MSVSFALSDHPLLFESKWEGSIDPQDMLDSYERFFASQEGADRHLEYADFSQADMSEIRVPDLQKLCDIIAAHYKKHEVQHARCASWMPREINRSLMEIYAFLSKLSPEVTQVFGTRKEAMEWLMEGEDLDYEVALRIRAC